MHAHAHTRTHTHAHTIAQDVKIAGTIATFKKYGDLYLDRKGLEEYGPNARRWD